MKARAGAMLGCGLALVSARGAEMVRTLEVNRPVTLTLPWKTSPDETVEPRGYNHHGPVGNRFLHTLTVENSGSTAVRGVRVEVNGRDWEDLASLDRGYGWSRAAAGFPRAFFSFWTQARSHAASGSKAAADPLRMLSTWGYTLCGEDTAGLTAIFAQRQIGKRSVPLNGHVAGEYFIDGKWSVLDGDQNIAYLGWDNHTLASYEEIRADPLLALRTKPFGRFASWSLPAAQFNAGLFEYLRPVEQKVAKPARGDQPAANSSAMLYPGERLIFHYDQSPQVALGQPDAPESHKAAPSALRLVELQVSPQARGWKAGPLEVQTPYPVLPESGSLLDPKFTAALAVHDPREPVSVWMQASRLVLPAFQAGGNSLQVRGEQPGPLTVRLEYDEAGPNLPPPTAVSCATPVFAEALPLFSIQPAAAGGRLWWQISEYADFSFVPPNLEQIQPYSTSLALDALTCTFFRPGVPYYIRVKSVRQGVWGAWSEPAIFQVKPPSPPAQLRLVDLGSGHARLTWQGDAEEYAVVGSNRLGFLPEIYAAEEIVSMRNHEVLRSRPNRNLLATVAQPQLEFRPTTRYLRVIAKRGGLWSIPSALLTLPREWSDKLPLSTVFQIRWSTVKETAEHDLYEGEERALPAGGP